MLERNLDCLERANNEFLAEQFWPGEEAVGKRMKVQPTSDPDNDWLTVVGIAKNAVRNNWRNTPEEEMYLPLLQQREFPSYLSFAVRTRGEPASIHASTSISRVSWARALP